MREGRRQGVRLGLASGRCALGAASAERASHWAVASSSLGDSPGCWPSAGPGTWNGRENVPAGPSGRALSGRGPGLGCPARWAGRRVPDGAGPRLSIRSAGEASVLRTRRWESGRPHLFLSHCSLAGKEMTAGVSHPGALTPALRCVCLQARGLSLPPASGLAQCWPLSHSPSAYCPLCAPPLIFREGRTQRDLVMPLWWTNWEDRTGNVAAMGGSGQAIG